VATRAGGEQADLRRLDPVLRLATLAEQHHAAIAGHAAAVEAPLHHASDDKTGRMAARLAVFIVSMPLPFLWQRRRAAYTA